MEKEEVKSLDVTSSGDSAGSPIDSSGLQPFGIDRSKKKKKKKMESIEDITRTTEDNEHYHHLIVDEEGNGRTLDTIPTEHPHHVHLISEGNVMESDGHIHKIEPMDNEEEDRINEIMEIMRYIEDVKKGTEER